MGSKGSLKMKVAWAALTLAPVLMPEAKQAPQGPPLLRCDPNKQTVEMQGKGGISTECIELCKEYGKNNDDGEKYCADLVHCHGILEDENGNGGQGRRVCFFRYLLYFIISILSGLFLRFLVVLYLLMPGMPLPFCSVHSNVTMTLTCFPFFAMQVTCL